MGMQPIAMLLKDDPWLSMPPTQRAAMRRERRNKLRSVSFDPFPRPVTFFIPNTPFGVPKTPPPKVFKRKALVSPNPEPAWWPSMWFWDLVNGGPREHEPVTVERVIRIVAAFYGFTRLDMISIRRTAPVVRARQVGVYLAKTMTVCSLPAIGRRFGGRDHTTILYAVNKIRNLINTDEKLADEVAQLKRRISA